MTRKYAFETLQVRAGQEIDPVSKGTAVPIYQSTAYVFDDMQYGADLFALKKPGNIYTRITNTTTEVFEKRMAALENGVAAVATASGQSAVFLSILNVCGPGDNVVASPFLYGGTFTMFEITLRDMGIEVRFANSDKVDDMVDLVNGRTKAIFLENLGNPAFNVPDYEPIIEMAHLCDGRQYVRLRRLPFPSSRLGSRRLDPFGHKVDMRSWNGSRRRCRGRRPV